MMLGPDDLWLFNEGAHTRLYEHLGAQTPNQQPSSPDASVPGWAPRCS
jgi:1,4-alpha-glucan branching enzyme